MLCVFVAHNKIYFTTFCCNCQELFSFYFNFLC
uniref:Uncharacterized protein n=1 Tax=Podoviridae sp. ctWeH21 TaxID=2825255 RepID=A0A8S5PHJ4_9CAUD|nr:MAG TPA: hypothetical protein [Podoviridae sp. ctWeH21]